MKNNTTVITVNNTTVISVLISVFLIGGAILFFGGDQDSDIGTGSLTDNVSIVDGKQIITINAKGGYFPKITIAKADLPTILKVSTRGTFDCSAALTIPNLQYRKNLPPSGETAINVPPQKAGAIMRGSCSMGMYNFVIRFYSIK